MDGPILGKHPDIHLEDVESIENLKALYPGYDSGH
jgi:hypothetical protein